MTGKKVLYCVNRVWKNSNLGLPVRTCWSDFLCYFENTAALWINFLQKKTV